MAGAVADVEIVYKAGEVTAVTNADVLMSSPAGGPDQRYVRVQGDGGQGCGDRV